MGGKQEQSKAVQVDMTRCAQVGVSYLWTSPGQVQAGTQVLAPRLTQVPGSDWRPSLHGGSPVRDVRKYPSQPLS